VSELPVSPAPEEAARPAGPDDVDAIVALAADLRAELADHRGGALWAAHDGLDPVDADAVRARLDAAHLSTVAGTLDGHVLAYALAHVETLDDGRRLAVIDELFVAEPARTVGLGEIVLRSLVNWAATERCLGIDATALPGDRLAKNFFEAAGFTARRLVMHHPLTPGP
jgi:GNAT superfamily N-acetyltransferase